MLTLPLQLPDADIVFYPSLLDQHESDRFFTQLSETINPHFSQVLLSESSKPLPGVGFEHF